MKADRNCVAVRRGGEQRKASLSVRTIRKSIRPCDLGEPASEKAKPSKPVGADEKRPYGDVPRTRKTTSVMRGHRKAQGGWAQNDRKIQVW